MKFVQESARFWITTLLAIGTTLGLVLLTQTVVNYRYVSNNLIQDEARRVAENTVRAVERGVRLAAPRDEASLQALLDELRSERRDQVAGFAVRLGTGVVIASGELTGPQRFAVAGRIPAGRRMRTADELAGGREVLVGDFPCRCDVPSGAGGQPGASSPAGRASITVAVYGDSLSAPFARLRRNSLVNISAALTLLIALGLIALRFGPYVRGKQLEAQVTLARDVQRNLLPDGATLPTNLDIAAECIPASRVGGDFYDIVALPAGRYAFIVGDVSGHGISAALLMGLIHGAMSAPPWGVSEDEAERAARLNHLLLTKSSTERFASLFWCAFDPASARLRYINAGHPPPIWIAGGAGGVPAVHRLADGGPILGVLPEARFATASIQAQAGDLLILFSDGLVEAANDRDEFFGEERLIALVQRSAHLPARSICRGILSAVQTFAGDRPIVDDQTLLVVRLPGAHHSPPAPD